MNSFLIRCAALSSLATLAALSPTPALSQNWRYEAEVAQRTGVQVSTSVGGFSGTGYVTGFDSQNGADKVQWQVDVPNGL